VIGGQLASPPTPTISTSLSNQNFEIAILFSVIERSGNYIFKDGKSPTVLRDRVISYTLETYEVYIEKGDRIKFGGGSLDW
jgi:hypothetical protein